MPWTGSAGSQVFTRTDGTRTGAQVWQQADAASVDIIAVDHDTHDEDIGDGVSACLKKDGGNSATSNIPMGGFTFSNLAVATSSTMPARASDVQSNRLSYCTVGGGANTITLTNTVPIAAYVTGQEFRFTALYSNSSTVTIAVDGLTATAVTVAGVPLTAGQIVAGAWITVAYNGTSFEFAAGAAPAAIWVGSVMAWPMDGIPSGWLECDGSAVSRTTYSALYSIIGTNYGIGDGSTTFNIPNYQDYFMRGFDSAGTNAATRTDRGDGTTGGHVGTKQASDYLAHTHTASVTDPGHTHTYLKTGEGALRGGGASDDLDVPTSTATGSSTTGITVSNSTAPATGGSETRPKNITVKWLILALPSAGYSIGAGKLFTQLTANYTLTDSASAQKAFNTSTNGAITVAGSTSYSVEGTYYLTNTGTTSHTWGLLFGGAATITAAGTMLFAEAYTATSNALTTVTGIYISGAGVSSVTVLTSASTSATENVVIKFKGRININAGGTLIPQVKASVQPNGTETMLAGSYIELVPLGANTVTTSGAWT